MLVWHERFVLAATRQDATEWAVRAPDLHFLWENFTTQVERSRKLAADGAQPVLALTEPASCVELRRSVGEARLEELPHHALVSWTS